MKIEGETNKRFDAVKMMREIRNKIDKETEGMTFEQLKEYYRKGREKIRNKREGNNSEQP